MTTRVLDFICDVVIANILPVVVFIWAWFALSWQQALLFDMTELILGLALRDIWYATVKR